MCTLDLIEHFLKKLTRCLASGECSPNVSHSIYMQAHAQPHFATLTNMVEVRVATGTGGTFAVAPRGFIISSSEILTLSSDLSPTRRTPRADTQAAAVVYVETSSSEAIALISDRGSSRKQTKTGGEPELSLLPLLWHVCSRECLGAEF